MCGITGVFAPGRDAARLAFFALYALQHRGQESAGIAVADGGTIRSHKEMGLLSAIFDEDVLGGLSGYIAVGHTRYSTSGSSIVVNAQPLLERTELGDVRVRPQRQPHQHRRTARDALADDRIDGHLRFGSPGED